jgi:hypothetical protein
MSTAKMFAARVGSKISFHPSRDVPMAAGPKLRRHLVLDREGQTPSASSRLKLHVAYHNFDVI